jgi:hypothetical protein
MHQYSESVVTLASEPAKMRGTGRTYNQLSALPERAIFLVHNQSMKLHAVNILQRLDKNLQTIKVLIIHDMHSLQMLRGMSAPIYVDHWLWDHGTPEFRAQVQQHRHFVGGNP